MDVARREHADGRTRSYTASATHQGVVWACGQVPVRVDEFDGYDAAYQARLSGRPLPPRTTVQVARFRGEKRIEVECGGDRV